MKNGEWLLKQGINFDDIYLTAPANYIYVIEDKTGRRLGSVDNSYSEISAFKKWLDAEYKEQILDDAEKKYLSAVIRPFRDDVLYIEKYNGRFRKVGEFEKVIVDYNYKPLNQVFCFDLPPFEKGAMYKGMKAGQKYTLEELGL